MSSKKKKSKNKKSKNTNISNKSKQNNPSINSKNIERKTLKEDNNQIIENKSNIIKDLEKNTQEKDNKTNNSEQVLQEQASKTNNTEENNNSTYISKYENDKINDNSSYQYINKNNNTTSIDSIEKTIKETKPKDQKNIVENENLDNKNTHNNIKNNNLNTKNSNTIYKKKNKTLIAIIILLIIIVLLICSTIFAFLNVNKNTFAKGVSINNIDISNLSIEEAKKVVSNATQNQLILDIELKYQNEVQYEFNPNQIEYSYDIDNSLTEAYNVGKNGNIVQNNYELLYTAFFNKNINLNFNYNEDLLNSIIDDVGSKIPGIVIEPTYYIEDNELIINKGTDGIIVNKEELKNNILDNINNRTLDNTEKQTIEIPVLQSKASPINIEKIYSEIYTEPQNAYYETDPFQIYPEVNGIDLEISLEEAKKIISSENKDEYRFKLKITPASKTINDIGTEAFPYLISTFSTKYDASNINRSKNLAIAAGKINGTVLMPGETFSFNKVVGKRTIEEGYRDAKIYENGTVVDGLAGGICQISSTLYNSVVLANLEIVERRNHSFTTSYVPAGRDATVVYGVKDFKFKNSRTYPIKIEANVSNGIAEFKIHGIAEETEYEIKIIPVTNQSIPYATETIIDPALAPGQRIVTQAGHPGYKVTTYKELRLNGVTVSKDILSNDTYQPMKSIVRVGP